MKGQFVIVIGGGIAGLCTAYFLRRDGADVVVLEADHLGSGASSGNAGWICPAQSGPLPEPGLATYGIKSAFKRDSALYISPGHLPATVGWLLRFARHCNERDHRHGTEALARLGQRTFALHDQFAEEGVEFESRRSGMLVVAERRASAESFLRGLGPLREFGFAVPKSLLEAAATREHEPMLSGAIAAGIPIEEHVHVDPMSLVRGLAAHLKQMGVAIEERSEVTGIRSSRGYLEIKTRDGLGRVADKAIITTGAWTSKFMRRAGVWLPIIPGKGYSFEVAPPVNGTPRSAMLLLDAHVAVSPFSDRVRLAGTMEFSGLNKRLDHRRIESIAHGAARMLPDLDVNRRANAWAGMRPIAPDGLPVIDRVPGAQNLYVASAYSMLGMTLAAPAGEALAKMVRTGQRPPMLEPFRVDRFKAIRRPWRPRS